MAIRKLDRIPAPIYAAAGAGDLAYQKLRTLPAKVSELRGKIAERRPVVTDTVRTDLDRLRDVARRNATTFIDSAHAAQERAVVVYGDLVARGERVVNTARTEAAPESKTEVAVVEAAPVAEISAATTSDAVTEPLPAAKPKPAKRTRPTAKQDPDSWAGPTAK